MKWLRKRGIPCLLIFSLLFSFLAVPALALKSLTTTRNDYSFLPLFNLDTGEIGPFKVSMLDETSRAFWNELEERDFSGVAIWYSNSSPRRLTVMDLSSIPFSSWSYSSDNIYTGKLYKKNFDPIPVLFF